MTPLSLRSAVLMALILFPAPRNADYFLSGNSASASASMMPPSPPGRSRSCPAAREPQPVRRCWTSATSSPMCLTSVRSPSREVMQTRSHVFTPSQHGRMRPCVRPRQPFTSFCVASNNYRAKQVIQTAAVDADVYHFRAAQQLIQRQSRKILPAFPRSSLRPAAAVKRQPTFRYSNAVTPSAAAHLPRLPPPAHSPGSAALFMIDLPL